MKALTPETFDATLKEATKPVLVKFGATWCYPCRALTPVVAEVALKFAKRVDTYSFDMDTDKGDKITKKLKILSIPTLIVFKKGVEKARLIGTAGQSDVQRFISRAVPAKKRKV